MLTLSLPDFPHKPKMPEICNGSSEDLTRTYDVQECLDEEDVNIHKEKCKKHPGHNGFIPINKLKIEHFPYGYDDLDVYNLTMAMSDLVLRVAVIHVSLNRPEFVPGTKDPYPCYKTRGQNSLHIGTGRVLKAITYKDDKSYSKTCPCPECEGSATPSKVWSLFTVLTAKHVVFDSIEARNTKCRLWFDDDQSPEVNISGWKLSGSDIQTDWCWMYCLTHDTHVADKVAKKVRRFNELSEKLYDKYKNKREKLVIIVSHPHGGPKQVSIGEWVDKQSIDGGTRYTYTADTCPGSCGAVVYRIGMAGCGHPHIGSISKTLNYSGIHSDFDY